MENIYRNMAIKYYEEITNKIINNKDDEIRKWKNLVDLLLDQKTIKDTIRERVEKQRSLTYSEDFFCKFLEEYEKKIAEEFLLYEHFTKKHANTSLEQLVGRILKTFNATSSFLTYNDNGDFENVWEDPEDAKIEMLWILESDKERGEIASALNSNLSYKIIKIPNYFDESQQVVGITRDLSLAQTKSVRMFISFSQEKQIFVKTFYPDLYEDYQKIEYDLNPIIAEILSKEDYEPNKVFWLTKKACIGLATATNFENDNIAFHCEPHFTLETENIEEKKIHHFTVDIPGDEVNDAYQIKISIPQNGNELTNPKLFIGTRSLTGKFCKDETKCGKNGLPLMARKKDEEGYFLLVNELKEENDGNEKKIGDSFFIIKKIVDAINESREIYSENQILNFLNKYDPEKIKTKEAADVEKDKIAVKEILEKYQNKEDVKSIEDLDKIFKTNTQNSISNTSRNDFSEDAR